VDYAGRGVEIGWDGGYYEVGRGRWGALGASIFSSFSGRGEESCPARGDSTSRAGFRARRDVSRQGNVEEGEDPKTRFPSEARGRNRAKRKNDRSMSLEN